MPNTLATWLPEIEMGNLSGEVSHIIRDELSRMGVTKSGKSNELKIVLSSEEARSRFILNYQVQFKAVLDKLSDEYVLELNEEQKTKLASYVNDALSKFKVSTAGRHVEELLAPLMGSGIISFAEDAVQEGFKHQAKQLEDLAVIGLSYLSKLGVKYKEVGEVELSRQWAKLKERLVENDLNEIILKSTFEKAAEMIKNNPHGIILNTTENLEKKVTDEFKKAATDAMAAAKKSFNELKQGIDTLTNNEILVNEILEEFEKEIRERSNEIKVYEEDIYRLARQGKDKLEELGKKQIEHAQLVAESLLQNNILNGYLQKGVHIIDSIDEYKNKADRIFSGEYLEEFKKRLDKLKEPTLSGVVKFASGTLDDVNQISNTLGKLGIINPKAAQTVGRFVGYAKLAIGIATALLPPNPIGIISALGSLGGLFGGGGPTIEEEMFKAMQEGFNQLNERLDKIEEKIDRLSEFVQTMYKDIMNSLQAISNDLDQVKEQLELITQMLSLIIYKDYNLVEEIIKIKESGELAGLQGLEFYKSWYKREQNFGRALSELSTIITSSKTLRGFIREEILLPGENKKTRVIGLAEDKAYKATLELFRRIFTKNGQVDEKIKNLLLLPPQCNAILTFTQGSALMPEKSGLNFDAATEDYFNARIIAKLVDQYHVLHPFFAISHDDRFEPFQSLEKLLAESDQIKGNLGQSKGRWDNLIKVINYSIVQQSILSGAIMVQFINTILFGNEEINYEACKQALEANELLAKNVAVHLINLKIQTSDLPTFFKLFYEVKADPKKTEELNKLLKFGLNRLEFDFDDRNPSHPLLCLFYKKPGSNEKIRLPLPELTVIEDQQMLYGNDLIALLAAKQKAVIALIDIHFFQGLSTQQTSIYKELYFIQS